MKAHEDHAFHTNANGWVCRAGFRGHGSEAAGKDWADPLQHGEPGPGPSAFEDFARGGSYARQTSDTMLKRRNSSVGRRAPGQQPQRELHTIYSATSLRAHSLNSLKKFFQIDPTSDHYIMATFLAAGHFIVMYTDAK